MTAPLVVVTGTGTGIGKTHFTAALLRCWARLLDEAGVARPQLAGLKPVESGVSPANVSDAVTLEQASTFHVKRFPAPYMLTRPVSPHLAAATEGRTIELDVVRAYVAAVQPLADGVAVELPGGLFSPLAPGLDNAAAAQALAPDALLLVAPDRLGVLHDVGAATRAAAACRLAVTGIVLVAPETPDASTGTNASELAVVCSLPVLANLPRADVATLSRRADIAELLGDLVRERPRVPLRP